MMFWLQTPVVSYSALKAEKIAAREAILPLIQAEADSR